jgi:hypothetical protein
MTMSQAAYDAQHNIPFRQFHIELNPIIYIQTSFIISKKNKTKAHSSLHQAKPNKKI